MNPTSSTGGGHIGSTSTTVIAQAASSSTGVEGGDGEDMSDDDEDDDDIGSSSDGDPMDEGGSHYMIGTTDIATQLAAAGTTGMAAAAAITSTKKRKRLHSFETNPSVRKRQQTRLLRKLRHNIEEYSLRVGQQAIILVACPGSKHQNNFRAFGANPLEDVVKNLRNVIMTELESSLARQAPPSMKEDPGLHELPPLVVDGIPTPVEKMTQAQLRAFIPLMLKYSTGRGKPGWGKESTRPSWWPKGVPWANVRMDARKEDDKQKVSWTHALRQIVLNCYKYHGRDDLLPVFAEDEEGAAAEAVAAVVEQKKVQYAPTTVLQTISNSDGSVSIIQVDPNNPVITLPDGTLAHIANFEAGQPGVHTLAEVASVASEQREQQQQQQAQLQAQQAAVAAAAQQQQIATTTTTALEINGEMASEGTILIAGEDGIAYPVQVGGGGGILIGGNVYQVVPSGDTVQIISGSQLQALNGQIVPKIEPGTQPSQTAQSKGLTITPVATTAVSPAPAPPQQQQIAVSGLQQGQIIQIVQNGGPSPSVAIVQAPQPTRKPLILTSSTSSRAVTATKSSEGPSSSS